MSKTKHLDIDFEVWKIFSNRKKMNENFSQCMKRIIQERDLMSEKLRKVKKNE